MGARALRPLHLPRFRRSRVRLSVEALALRHQELVQERQELRSAAASDATLERNRVQIARCQFELSHALIERYLPRDASEHAA
jgi:hypothetical protein